MQPQYAPWSGQEQHKLHVAALQKVPLKRPSDRKNYALPSMMDPLSALAVAGTTVQFVDFSSKLISATCQLYSNSELKVHEQAAAAANDLLDYSTKIRRPLQLTGVSGCLTEDEAVLEAVCHGRVDLAESFLKHLSRLKVPGQDMRRIWDSLRHAVLSVWTKDELDSIEQRLVEFQREIDARVLLSLRYVWATLSSAVGFKYNDSNTQSD